MVGRAPSGMGIFPKTETRCHNFSFFRPSGFPKTRFSKNYDKLWQRVSDFGKLPIPDGARSTIRRS
jgi:hypothetical protein